MHIVRYVYIDNIHLLNLAFSNKTWRRVPPALASPYLAGTGRWPLLAAGTNILCELIKARGVGSRCV